MKALSIRQPWAWLIIHAGKDIENRTWSTARRGPVFIHAGKTMTKAEYCQCCRFLASDSRLSAALKSLPAYDDLQRQCGGIVGAAHIVDCVTDSASPWFVGEYGFVLERPIEVKFTPCKGALGFFEVDKQIEASGTGTGAEVNNKQQQ